MICCCNIYRNWSGQSCNHIYKLWTWCSCACDKGTICHHIHKIQPFVCTSHCFQKLHSLLIISYPSIINMFHLKSTIFNMEGSSNVEVNDEDEYRADQPHFNAPWFKNFPHLTFNFNNLTVKYSPFKIYLRPVYEPISSQIILKLGFSAINNNSVWLCAAVSYDMSSFEMY
jgi:hypothetical protein